MQDISPISLRKISVESNGRAKVCTSFCPLGSAFDPSPLQDFCVAVDETDGGMRS